MATSDSTYDKNRLLMKARKSSFVSLSVINRLLNEVWQTTNRIEEWKGIREQTITHPTSMIRDDISHNLYVELPEVSDRYWYKTDDDFRTIEISFEKKPGFSEVSSDAARFGELSTIPGVKEGVFDKINIPISFEMGRFIVSPPLFKNIIKGAIGEYVGTFLLESVGIHVSDMPDDQFERFDGQLAPGIFVDFKHWVSSSFTTRDEQLEKIREKLKEVGGGKVFIINILGSSSDLRPVTVDGGDVIEVPYLYDTVRNEFNETALKMIKEVII